MVALEEEGYAVGVGFVGFFAATGLVGLVHGGVELLVGLEQGRGHGERVVQVGQAAAGKLGAGVEHRLCCNFDSALRSVYGGWRLILLGTGCQRWPG